ncbi:MAG: hypothetical protein GKR90_27340 [Pseudomonadales bacterium]|nr:hypothetical protein [Pseudomonadales bacterium]
MTPDIAFLILFLIQAVFVSLYFPYQIVRRTNAFIEEFPSDVYPRLYSWSAEKWRRTARSYQVVCLAVFAVGMLIFLGFVFFGFPNLVPETALIYSGFTALQVACNVWRAKMAIKRLKAIELEDPSVRHADLVPRRLTDYVSPFHWGIALISMLFMLGAGALLAITESLIPPIVFSLLLLFLNGVFLRNGLKIVRGELPIPQLASALDMNVTRKLAVRSVPDTMIRVNLTWVAVALVVVSGAQDFALAVVCALVVANEAYERIKELQIRDEELLDMQVFENASSHG